MDASSLPLACYWHASGLPLEDSVIRPRTAPPQAQCLGGGGLGSCLYGRHVAYCLARGVPSGGLRRGRLVVGLLLAFLARAAQAVCRTAHTPQSHSAQAHAGCGSPCGVRGGRCAVRTSMQQPFGFCASCASKLGLLDLRTLACGCGHSSDQDTPPSSKVHAPSCSSVGRSGSSGSVGGAGGRRPCSPR